MPPSGETLLAQPLRQAAQLADGNKILRFVANQAAAKAFPQPMLTAMAQLAATGAKAYAAYLAAPTSEQELAAMLGAVTTQANAQTIAQQVMSDFNNARTLLRTPESPRSGAAVGQQWIAVSGQDDPPDVPVNVPRAPYEEFYQPITVNGRNLTIRYIIANNSPLETPTIPIGSEVILFIHGEGSKAEEALDFIPPMLDLGPAVGRNFTVIAFDQPNHGYTMPRIDHTVLTGGQIQDVAGDPPPAPSANCSGFEFNVHPASGTPILDFDFQAITAFVEALRSKLQLTKPITVVGGSLGGHMALRFAASGLPWVARVVAWSPACVWDTSIPTIPNISQNILTIPRAMCLASQAAQAPEPDNWKLDFFNAVFNQDTFDASMVDAAGWAGIGAALALGGPLLIPFLASVAALPSSPPQPQQWYWDGWPGKANYIEEGRRDRWEIYGAAFRRWHWRIAADMFNFSFDSLKSQMKTPLMLMAGADDDFPYVHFATNVPEFAKDLTCPGVCLTVQNTGHSIHNERPSFLANQVAAFVAGCYFGNMAGSLFLRGDFAKLGHAQMLLYHPGDNNWWLAALTNGNLQWSLVGNTNGFGNTRNFPTWTADFTGAGHDQVLFYSPGDGHWWLGTYTGGQINWTLVSQTRNPNGINFGDISHYPMWTGDFTGVGHSQMLFYSPSDGHWWLATFNGASFDWSLFGQTRDPNTNNFGDTSGDPTWIGDFTGAGHSQALFFSPDGNWWLGSNNGGKLQWSNVGNSNAISDFQSSLVQIGAPFAPGRVGDFNGAQHSQLLLYQPKDENWWLGSYAGAQLQWSNVGNTSGFGNTSTFPTWTGDFMGVGHSQALFYSPGDQNWWLGSNSGGKLQWSKVGNTAGFGNTAQDPTFAMDFTGAGHLQLLFYSPVDGHWWHGTPAAGQITWSLVGCIGI
jgi:pimeloyl-ACP methyl ester carboxylesterase